VIYRSREHLKLKLLVDTASTYTWVKRDKLEKLDVKPITKRKFKTIDGKIIERETVVVPIKCLNERATTIVVFAEDEDA